MKHLLILLSFVSISISSFSQDPFCETIVTQGKSSVKQTPEIISFYIEYRVEDQDYNKCANTALLKIDTMKMRFREFGIDEELIKTLNYSISEVIERDDRNRHTIHRGYRARVPISIKTKVDDPHSEKIFEIAKSTFQSDIRINFELSQKQINEVKEKLISLAVDDATSKAKILAKNLNVELGKVSKVQYGDPQTIRNFTRSNYDLQSRVNLTSSVSRASITSLTPNEITMNTSVMLAWEIIY